VRGLPSLTHIRARAHSSSRSSDTHSSVGDGGGRCIFISRCRDEQSARDDRARYARSRADIAQGTAQGGVTKVTECGNRVGGRR